MALDDRFIVYGYCHCYVWPLVAYQGRGRCGRCGQRCQGSYQLRDEAIVAFNEEFGRVPVPMG